MESCLAPSHISRDIVHACPFQAASVYLDPSPFIILIDSQVFHIVLIWWYLSSALTVLCFARPTVFVDNTLSVIVDAQEPTVLSGVVREGDCQDRDLINNVIYIYIYGVLDESESHEKLPCLFRLVVHVQLTPSVILAPC